MNDLVRWQLDGTGFTLEDFAAKDFVNYGKEEIFWDQKEGLKIKTPSGKIEFRSSLLENAGFPSFLPVDKICGKDVPSWVSDRRFHQGSGPGDNSGAVLSVLAVGFASA